jgi:hypothetical protein
MNSVRLALHYLLTASVFVVFCLRFAPLAGVMNTEDLSALICLFVDINLPPLAHTERATFPNA